MGNALVSFVVPTRNREAWLPECLGGLVMQTVKDIEIVVVNDASEDGTKSLLDKFYSKYPSIKIIHNETKQGAGMSRNIGIQNATAPIIGVCDDDDIYPIERAEKIIEFYEGDKQGMMMNAPYVSIGYCNELLERYNGSEFDEKLFKESGRVSYFCHPTAAYYKEDILKIGGYKEENKEVTDDYQLVVDWLSSGNKIGFAKNDFLCMHRVLPKSIMASMRGFDPKWVGKK